MLRLRVVAALESGKVRTYRQAAQMFGVGELWFPPNRGGLLYAASRVGAAVFS